MEPRDVWAAWVVCGSLILSGCSQAVMMAQESEQAGLVTYLYKSDRGGPMGSPYRRDAIQAMDRKCPGGYRVVREGPARSLGRGSMPDGMYGAADEDAVGLRWGIQFTCR